jgi:hypothetical protein
MITEKVHNTEIHNLGCNITFKTFLGAFAKLRKAIIGCVMSDRLSVRMESGSLLNDLIMFDI